MSTECILFSMDWKGKTIFLTGASSGIGEGLAVAMAEKGATLAIVARREEELTRIAEQIAVKNGIARVFAVDVTEAESMAKAAQTFRDEFGHIDIMIANAGIGGNDQKTREYDPASVKKLIDINLLGAVNSIHAVIKPMQERKSGHIVAISSLAGFRGLLKSAAYSASKAGMTAFFESVRLDNAESNIDVTIIQPGFIKTPLTSGREAKMPFLMNLEDAIPHFLHAIERKKKFAAFPWQLATIVRLGKYMPAWMYDRIAGKARYRE